ncbi:MAG: bifunctional nuclease family protein [Acidimicrobiia bacterium]|nr:bifunctional nuclease family protein [Acidimicrobiia bacterium]
MDPSNGEESSQNGDEGPEGAVPVEIVGVRIELPSNQPIVLLKELGGIRYLPIWIGASEATAIASALQGVEPPRPLTHDLLTTVIQELGAEVQRIVVSDMRDSVYYADLFMTHENQAMTISSRPSDAIALAIRIEAPVFASRAVFDEAGIDFADQEDEEEIEEFRRALDEATIEDFLGNESGENPES